jgi:DNA-binding NarL/FixJ family response regulator
MKKIKIVVVDDHEIFLKGICKLLTEFIEIEILDTFADGEKLLLSPLLKNADLILLDLQLPDYEPEILLGKLREAHPHLPILYLTMMRGSRLLHKLEKLSIQGYILKDSPVVELVEAIRKVAAGGEYFSGEITELQKLQQKNTTTVPENKLNHLLSKREYEILILICKELSSAEIGEKLFLSTGTVDTHRRNILVKCGVNNTVGLVKFAFQNGLLNEE